jgi:sec-independent protein translocase protein TatC
MSTSQKLTVLGHLHELRNRLIKCVIALVITTVVAFVFADWIFYALILPTGGIQLIYIEMTEMLGTYMRVALAGGIVLAMPYLVYQVIMFVAPALTAGEKKYVYLILPWVGLMFVGGVIFGYFVLIPPAIRFLLTFGSNIAIPQIKVGSYISLVTRLLLAIGLVFELPVITTFLARIGIIKAKWLADRRRIAIILAFVLGAVITPTFDPINQTLVAVPLIVLYEMSIWLARLVQKKEPRATAPS